MATQLEIACFNAESVKIAADSGADRIEFAEDYGSGGITPNPEDFTELRNYTKIPIFILIRCRPGNFVYSKNEVEIMISSINTFKKMGADGFVLGCLNETNEIDIESTKKLFHEAQPKICTFHRAFDRLIDMKKGMEQIINLGFQSILTSGGEKNALAGADVLNELNIIAAQRIILMAGGGIRSNNISALKEKYQTNWYHSACINPNTLIADSYEIKKIKFTIES